MLWSESYIYSSFEDFWKRRRHFHIFQECSITSWKLNVILKDKIKTYEKSTIYKCGERQSMTIGCNIWMICLLLNRFFYGLSRILHLSEFVWILRSSVWVVFNNFLLIDATARSKISSDQKRFFSYNPLFGHFYYCYIDWTNIRLN